MTLNSLESRQSRLRSPNGRIGRSVKTVVIIFLVAVVAIVGLVFWQVSSDGLQTKLLNGMITEAVQSRMPPGSEISLGATRFRTAGQSNIEIELTDLALTLQEKARANVSSLIVNVPFRSLWAGRIDPHSIRLNDVELALAGLALAPDDGSSRADKIRAAVKGFSSAFAQADRPMRDIGLSEVKVSNFSISSLSEADPLPDILNTIRAKDARWSILPGDRSKVWANVSNGDKAWNLILERDPEGSTGEQIELTIENFQPSSLFPRIADESKRPYFDSPLTFVGRAFLDDAGEVSQILARYQMHKGRVSLGFRDQINLEHIDLLLTVPAEGDTITLRKGTTRARQGGLSFAGKIMLPPVGDPIGLDIKLGQAVLAAGPGRDPVILKDGSLIAEVRPEESEVKILRLSAANSDGSASIAGTLGGVDEGAGIALAVELSEMPVGLLRALWPPALSPAVRRWFDGNVFHAQVGPGAIQVALPKANIGPAGAGKVMPSYALGGSLFFKEGEFRPARSYPEINNAAGSISFLDASAILSLDKGEVALPDTTSIDVGGTILEIPRLGAPGPVGELELSVTGSADSVAALSNAGPLNVADEQGIVPSDLIGNIDVRLSANVPLGPDNPKTMPPPVFRIALTEFSSSAPIDGRVISNADLILDGTPEAYMITGNADVDGINAELSMMSSDAENADIRVTLDEEERRKLGIDFGGLVSGPIRAAISGQDENLPRSVVLDLTPARISIPGIGWEKGTGVKGEARFVIEKTDAGSLIRDLVISGDTFRAQGEVRLKDNSGLDTISMTSAALRPGDKFDISIAKQGKSLDISVSGQSFDARSLIDAMKAPATEKGSNQIPLSVSFAINEVKGYNGAVFSDATGAVRTNSKGLKSISVQGLFGAGGPAEAVIENDTSMTLSARSQNAGELLRFLDIYERVNGGLLDLKMDAGASAGTEVGVLQITNFDIAGEQALSEVVQVPDRSTDAPDYYRVIDRDASKIGFTELGVPFRRAGGIINVGEAYLRGPVIGGTATGTLNLDEKTLAISGTFIPAYGLNNLAGAIPFFGEILGGGRNGGLLGITFRIYGPIASPTLNLNPVSAIAPGIFRKIFEYR